MSEYRHLSAELPQITDSCLKAGQPAPVIVVGAVNLDLSGTPFAVLRPADSNPGKVTVTPGGVGRNIAENLRRLGNRVSMLTAFGTDPGASLIRESCLASGIDLSLSFTFPDERTSTYLCVNESDGDLHTAVSDMGIYERLTPGLLENRLSALNSAAMVVLDANLPEEGIRYLCRNLKVPVAGDPVSCAKAFKLKDVLSYLTLIKPNVPEAELLTGMTIRSDADIAAAAGRLLASGVRWVFISLGSRGVYAADINGGEFLPCVPSVIRNTTGCGDAFLAAAADAFLHRYTVLEAARVGLASAALCAESEFTVNPSLTRDLIETRLKGVHPQ